MILYHSILLYAISQSLQQEKTGILGNCVFATFSKNIKQLTYAGCQSEIPPNSSRFRMNRKYCYLSSTKFSTMFRIGVEVYFTRSGYFTLGVWLVDNLIEHLGISSINYFLYWWEGPVYSLPPLYSSSGSSCISTKPVYSTSSATWLTLMPVRSDMATRVLLISGWMVAERMGLLS